MRLFLLFIAVPLIEIALFVQIGGAIGLFATLAIVIGTAILGSVLVRSQGIAVLSQLQNSMSELRDPTEPLVHGAMILFSGALLLTPGFFTDAIGFALMVPAVRRAVFQFASKRVKGQSFEYGTPPNDNSTVIDVEFEEVDPPTGPSGWTRH
ncbi:FxsA family protein [Rhodobacteraceae bacterium]|nr:FxsA family protein [Paracoccaceae bacterium]